jgi:hypothetical protein
LTGKLGKWEIKYSRENKAAESFNIKKNLNIQK